MLQAATQTDLKDFFLSEINTACYGEMHISTAIYQEYMKYSPDLFQDEGQAFSQSGVKC